MTKKPEEKKEDMPQCQCPYKTGNDGKCHKECLIYISATKKKEPKEKED